MTKDRETLQDPKTDKPEIIFTVGRIEYSISLQYQYSLETADVSLPLPHLEFNYAVKPSPAQSKIAVDCSYQKRLFCTRMSCENYVLTS